MNPKMILLLLLAFCMVAACSSSGSKAGFISDDWTDSGWQDVADGRQDGSSPDSVDGKAQPDGVSDADGLDGAVSPDGVADQGGADQSGELGMPDSGGPDVEEDLSCKPDCPALSCGDNGCGGVCKCPAGYACTIAAPLVCLPNCDLLCKGRNCGEMGVNQECHCGNCEDGKQCTADSCDASGQCRHELLTIQCNDGDPCTENDTCQADGGCLGELLDVAGLASAGCLCAEDKDCLRFDDKDPCNGTLHCVAQGQYKVCTVDQATIPDCGDGDVCTTDSCTKGVGCTYANNNNACDDSNPCTIGDICFKGDCLPGSTKKDCSDGNPCTDDTCDPSKPEGCVSTPNKVGCDDKNPCSLGDKCFNGTCVGGAGTKDCNDGNSCTEDLCDPLKQDGCWYRPVAGNCEDPNRCTTGDFCDGGVCKAGAGTLSCNDGSDCTQDSCDPSLGCVNKAVTGTCNDKDPCTVGDFCEGGICKPGSDTCACTGDPDCVKFDDGNLCNGSYYCKTSTSFPNRCEFNAKVVTCPPPPVPACQENTCRPGDGVCVIKNINEAGSCNDNNGCTLQDACAAGVCKGVACEALGQYCVAGKCSTCLPACTGKQCGPDGCGGSCSTCGAGLTCDEAKGLCVTTGMVLIPSGSFWMGCNKAKDSSCELNESPYHQVNLSAYEIDRTEVTQSAYKACVDKGGCGAIAQDCAAYVPASFPNRPAPCLSWEQARAYCAWSGKRLCTEAEWENGARGGDGRVFPWGDALASCTYANISNGTASGCGTGATKDVCSFAAGNSPWGLCDMAGNVWEWVNDWNANDYYCEGPKADSQGPCPTGAAPYVSPWDNPPGPSNLDGRKVVRGGSFLTTQIKTLRTSYRESMPLNDVNVYSNVGTRCCKTRL